jgi:hypothetical protein
MNDDTRKLLKVFGVAVTDAEAERNGWRAPPPSFRPAAARRKSPGS